MNPKFTNDQHRLFDAMSDISQETYAAIFMDGIEFVIWKALVDGDRCVGMGEIDSDLLDACASLSKEIGGWIIWSGDLPEFVTIDEWKKIYDTKI